MKTDKHEEFYPAEVVNEELRDFPATTTWIDSIFIPAARIPKDLLEKMQSNPEKLQQQLLSNLPLLESRVTQPYWSQGKNPRPFDAVRIQCYSSVCLAADRHCLESIVATSSMYKDLSRKTLRQAIKATKINFELEFLRDQVHDLLDENIFTSLYDYYLVDMNTLMRVLGLTNAKLNKIKVLERLRRLAAMELVILPEKDGRPISKLEQRYNLVDRRTIIPLLSLDAVRTPSNVTSDTFTHLIVGVDKKFTQTLENEGAIPRHRFLEVYPELKGKNQVTDFLKYLDTHDKAFLHNKYLKTFVVKYLERKARTSGKYTTTLVASIIGEVLEKRDVLYDKFGLLLTSHDKKGEQQWMFTHVSKRESE